MVPYDGAGFDSVCLLCPLCLVCRQWLEVSEVRDEGEPVVEPDRRSSALWEVVLRRERGQRPRPGALPRDQLPSGRQTGHNHPGRSRSVTDRTSVGWDMMTLVFWI